MSAAITKGAEPAPRYYREKHLANCDGKQGILAISKPTLWRWAREGRNGFPKPFKLGANVTVWDAAAIDAFIEKRAALSMG